MRYSGMPAGMWFLFAASFAKELSGTLGFAPGEAAAIRAEAKKEYWQIIGRLPEFEKGDRFKTNIVSCAMLAAFILHMPRRPELREMTEYYRKAMLTPAMRWFCRKQGRAKFSPADRRRNEQAARLRAADRNPYSWNMEFLPYEDGSGYEARFSRCGICALMKELGIAGYIPAMCALDYTMAEAGGVSDFVREYTLASGGLYCDCGYKRRSS